jgi:hypothetical protein
MNQELDKKAIKERIEALRKKIATQGIEKVIEKETTPVEIKNQESSLGKEGFFYILETKTLIVSIAVCLLIIATAYILNLRTDYLSQATNFIFHLFA